MGWQLDLMILKVLSNLNDSMILYKYAVNSSFWFYVIKYEKLKSRQSSCFITIEKNTSSVTFKAENCQYFIKYL